MPKIKKIFIATLFVIVIASFIFSQLPPSRNNNQSTTKNNNNSTTQSSSIAMKSKIPVDDSKPNIEVGFKNVADLSKYQVKQDENCPAFKGYRIESPGGAMSVAVYDKDLAESTSKEDLRFDMLQSQKYLNGILLSNKYQFVSTQNQFYRSFTNGCGGYYSETFLPIDGVIEYPGTEFAFGFVSLNGQTNILEPRIEVYAKKGNTMMFHLSDSLLLQEELNKIVAVCNDAKENDCYRSKVKEAISKLNISQKVKDTIKNYQIG
jgi:hypothetical protein